MYDTDEARRRPLVLLAENGLSDGREIVFFSDGTKNIRTRMESAFGFQTAMRFPDWHHLEQRVRKFLSMAHASLKNGEPLNVSHRRASGTGGGDAAVPTGQPSEV